MRRCFLLISLGLHFVCAQPARADFISEVLGDSPRGFWILNDVPGVPTTAVDSTVNAFNGTYASGVTPQGTAGPSWVPGSGLVADFTGGTVNFPATMDLGVNGYTIAAWINPSDSSLTQTTRIVASGSGFDGYGFGTASDGRLVFTSYGVRDYFTSGVTVLPNEWQYVAVVLDSLNDANFYVNGSLVETVPGGILGTQTPSVAALFTFGNESPPGATPEIYTGGLAGISVYDTALTEAQIQAQFNAATIPEPASLVPIGLAAITAGCAWWRRRTNVGASVPRQQGSADTFPKFGARPLV